ncbi:MAG: DISARM system helicase DrmA [Spirochaetaceae bacterium]|nr:DISARM system helicase DrmA [Spirochaetaceae bacterium]
MSVAGGDAAYMVRPADVRSRLREALELDLIGPGVGHPLADERLPGWVRPSNWYLTGFLVPRGASAEQRADADADDDFEPEVAGDGGLGDDSTEDRRAAKKGFFPSSMGLSFLVAEGVEELHVTVRWGDYRYVDGASAGDGEAAVAAGAGESSDKAEKADDGGAAGSGGGASAWWQRTARTEAVPVVLPGADDARRHRVPGSRGLVVMAAARPVHAASFAGRIPPGTRSVSLFLVNERVPSAGPVRDAAFAFQVEMEVRGAAPFVPRPDPRGVAGDDADERVADLHYADTPEYAAGHGVAADWELSDGACRTLRTTWIPAADVETTETMEVPGVELAMAALGDLSDGLAAELALTPLVTGYRAWIDQKDAALTDLTGERRDTAEELVFHARSAASRIEQGIRVLSQDADALDAFRVANRAVAAALSRRLAREGVTEPPRWRAFQLAFLLLNLSGLADPANPEREFVDLLFFPTGGGKTEAYLGLAAFTMVLRRLRNPEDAGRAGAGVSVIMRYTLRLLTLDQLGRAAGLVCALELERRKDAGRYGDWPFEIGLWVGKAGTPNRLGERGDNRSDSARSKVSQYKNNPQGRPAPIPLEGCPWCGEDFTPDSFALLPDADHPTELRIACANWECDFSGDTPLPIVAVDEPLYRRLPPFLVATVDKFASLPWVGESGALLGGADRHDEHGFYGAADPRRGNRLTRPLPPPDLVIQDELHLISGPLGTMAGLYEAAIEALCVREIDGRRVKPKIVASTATVRHAREQIQGLFGRPATHIFPPPGPSRDDSFFARTMPASERNARQYVGIASQGRNPKEAMRRVLLTLMGAAERAWRDGGGPRTQDNPSDPYMTVLGYFNSLRELGGARRILEEEVQNTLKRYGDRKRLGEAQGLFRNRTSFSDVVELTSRVSTDRVAEARRRLQTTFHDRKQRVDCAIATNMISVGLDIQRLGLMLVYGQPKTNSEYIQATSRVGRDDKRPGLVVMLYNVHRPRDRSHYERFRHYHETFYRSVEVASVTPFAARALDRGFAGALVTLARHARPSMTPPAGVEAIEAERVELERLLLEVFRARINEQPLQDEAEREERLRSIQNRIGDLLDSWRAILDDYRADGVAMQYQRYEAATRKPLLREMLDTDFESAHHRKFRANRSLRDVEPQVNLFLQDLSSRLSGSGE